jgi:Zn-dependent protease/CBS domain-containing protein
LIWKKVFHAFLLTTKNCELSTKGILMIGSGFRIGRLFGISIRVDWSWLFILVLITWNLTTIFGQVHPEWGASLNWGLALLAALLFFGSVLAHELAHSLVAKSQGLPVRNIVLFLFGGVSNIQREPGSPKDEFLMAIAGPATSLVLGVIMLLIGAGSLITAGQLGQPDMIMRNLSPINTILLWLGSVNLILAIFNLIPGFPLDGGRVLRSILWAITNNLRRATRLASFVGQAIAWIMIVAGISMAFGVRIPFFGTGLISGLWLAFIGWFLNSAAVQSYQQIEIQDILEGVPVSRLMRQNPPTVEPYCTISDLVHTHVMGTDDQAFPVMQQGHLVGIVTLDDIRRVPRTDWDSELVQEVMTPSQKLVTTAPNEDASQALEKLIQRDVRQLPVVVPSSASSSPELLGLLRRRDIMRWLQLHSDHPGNGRETI